MIESYGRAVYKTTIETAPWVAIFAGLMILVTVLGVNFIDDDPRDALDLHIRL
jgi:ABC-type dipeptide/oligopeptide/nickel transport system permease subunit